MQPFPWIQKGDQPPSSRTSGPRSGFPSIFGEYQNLSARKFGVGTLNNFKTAASRRKLSWRPTAVLYFNESLSYAVSVNDGCEFFESELSTNVQNNLLLTPRQKSLKFAWAFLSTAYESHLS
jgi:hypothetical protein